MTEEQLTLCKADVEAISNEDILVPNIPCNVYLSETELLHKWAMEDKLKLAVGGIQEDRIEQLDIRGTVLRTFQADWLVVRRTGKDAEKEWKAFSVEAYELCDELKHAFKYAFRGNSELLGRVDEIAKGTGDSDMIQDLKTYSQLGLIHQDLLTPIGFDLTKLATASDMSEQGADLLAEANGSKLKGNEHKVLRDKAYTHLKEVADDVRACGKYIFWKDKNRLVGYQSSHWKTKNSKRKKEEVETVDA